MAHGCKTGFVVRLSAIDSASDVEGDAVVACASGWDDRLVAWRRGLGVAALNEARATGGDSGEDEARDDEAALWVGLGRGVSSAMLGVSGTNLWRG